MKLFLHGTRVKLMCFNDKTRKGIENCSLLVAMLGCFIFFSGNLLAQEAISGLLDNPALSGQIKSATSLKSTNLSDTLKLPFIDDFSSPGKIPNQGKWVNKYVEVNSYYPANPVSRAVATFDDLNENGNLYPHKDSVSTFNGDTLTSKPINLKFKDTVRSDIYLSFCYQPGGYGNSPEPADSFILDFYKPAQKKWVKIWSAETISHQTFRQEFIPITGVAYLQAGFRFRFRSMASLKNSSSGPVPKDRSNDLWHLGLVRLDSARTNNDVTLKETLTQEPLKLPFIDDFSSSQIYPDNNKWADRDVFVNSTYHVNPVSVGVATLDALDANGQLYNSTSAGETINADFFTSRQINLEFPASKNIYLSFFYEPGGIAALSAPDPADSLFVDFYSPSQQAWTTKKRIAGNDNSQTFKQAFIPIDSAKYLQKGFRFRFRNLVSYGNSSTAPDGKNKTNGDFWHIDYVRIDTARNINDTIVPDIAFVKPMHSLLKSYQSMPWDHFRAAYSNVLRSQFEVTYKNNDKKDNNPNRYFEVRDLYGKTKVEYPVGAQNILAKQTFLLKFDIDQPPFDTPSTDSALFEVRSFLDTPNTDLKSNDTIRFLQIFSNYFAYDDGTPEFGYGLDNDKGGKVAYQFTAHIEDTLVAVRFYFNTSKWDKENYFKLVIWADNNGRPGNEIYSMDGLSTENLTPNKFNTFTLNKPVILKGKYYVGWIQETPFFMNVGYDLNNNSNAFTLYNSNGLWYTSAKNGSLMIRPVFRHTKDILLSNKNDLKTEQFSIFPNPVSDILTVSLPQAEPDRNKQFAIYNITGKMVMRQSLSNDHTIDVSGLPPGLYILTIESGNARFAPVKFLIQR